MPVLHEKGCFSVERETGGAECVSVNGKESGVIRAQKGMPGRGDRRKESIDSQEAPEVLS